MRPSNKLNQKLKKLYQLNSKPRPQKLQQKLYYYRKGRIPTNSPQTQKHGYICKVQPKQEISLRFSNNPHRVQMQRINILRQNTIENLRKNELIFYRKAQNQSFRPQKSSKALSPIMKMKTEPIEDNKQLTPLPSLLKKQSKYLNKMKIAIQHSAATDFAIIQAKSNSHIIDRIRRQKQLLDGLKGAKYFYTINRSLSIPNSLT